MLIAIILIIRVGRIKERNDQGKRKYGSFDSNSMENNKDRDVWA